MWESQRAVLFLALGIVAGISFVASHKKYNITIGYLPCIVGTDLYKTGLSISGALSMALEEINNDAELLPEVELQLKWNDTRCMSETATRLMTDMISAGVVAFFGPEITCHDQSIIAESMNVPMISYNCFDHQPSKSSNFVKFDPSATKVAKSVISLLRYYRWNKFSILYEEPWATHAQTIVNQAQTQNMTVNHQRHLVNSFKCCLEKMACCTSKYLRHLIRDTKDTTRIYVHLGSVVQLIDLMTIMEAYQMFEEGEYMFIFVDMTSYYSHETSSEYLYSYSEKFKKLQCPNRETIKRAQSLFVIVPSEPESDFSTFSRRVRHYNSIKPFEFLSAPVVQKYFSRYLRPSASYLYDSVKLYAIALHKLIEETTSNNEPLTHQKLMNIATNGSLIVSKMIQLTPFESVTGATTHLDEQGEAEGHFSLLAFKNFINDDTSCNASMVPVGHFQQGSRDFPEYKINPRLSIDWAGMVKPEAEPPCGFRNEKC